MFTARINFNLLLLLAFPHFLLLKMMKFSKSERRNEKKRFLIKKARTSELER